MPTLTVSFALRGLLVRRRQPVHCLRLDQVPQESRAQSRLMRGLEPLGESLLFWQILDQGRAWNIWVDGEGQAGALRSLRARARRLGAQIDQRSPLALIELALPSPLEEHKKFWTQALAHCPTQAWQVDSTPERCRMLLPQDQSSESIRQILQALVEPGGP